MKPLKLTAANVTRVLAKASLTATPNRSGLKATGYQKGDVIVRWHMPVNGVRHGSAEIARRFNRARQVMEPRGLTLVSTGPERAEVRTITEGDAPA